MQIKNPAYWTKGLCELSSYNDSDYDNSSRLS